MKFDPSNFDFDGHREFTEISAWTLCQSILGNSCDVLFDVGAHDGTGVLRWDNFFHPREIHAFEPDPDVFIKLGERKHETKAKFYASNTGVGSKEEVKVFSSLNQSGSSSFLPLNINSPYKAGIGLELAQEREVKIDTLDSYTKRNGIVSVDFLKIDVQGFEKEVLKGAEYLISTGAIKIIQLELIFRALYETLPLPSEIFSILESNNYRVLTMHSFWPSVGGRLFQCDVIFCQAGLIGE